MDGMYSKKIFRILVILAGMVSTPGFASAEWYADLYVGGTLTENTNAIQNSTFGPSTLQSDLSVDSSITGGGRAGYWFDGVPWYGAGLDVFYFQPNIPTQTNLTTITSPFGNGTLPITTRNISLPVVGIAFDVLRLRLPLLKSATYRYGRLQPYMTAGPALFITTLEDSNNFSPSNQSKTTTHLGVKVGGGIAFHVTEAIALFGEYRWTHFKLETTLLDNDPNFPPPSEETLKASFNTHHFIAGLSFHF